MYTYINICLWLNCYVFNWKKVCFCTSDGLFKRLTSSLTCFRFRLTHFLSRQCCLQFEYVKILFLRCLRTCLLENESVWIFHLGYGFFEPCWPHRMGRFFLLTQLVNEIKDSDVNSLSLLHFNSKMYSLSFFLKKTQTIKSLSGEGGL